MKVVFDFGGVLFRWRPRELLQSVWPSHAGDEAHAHALALTVFDRHWGEFDRGTVGVDELVAGIAARAGVSVAEAQALVDAVPAELAPNNDTVGLLARLHAAGTPLYYLSNMPSPYVTHLERTHGFLRCFKDGVFSSREKLIKPEPAIYALAERRFGLVPSRTVFIDDMPANVTAAQAAGWSAIHFVDAAQCERELNVLLAG